MDEWFALKKKDLNRKSSGSKKHFLSFLSQSGGSPDNEQDAAQYGREIAEKHSRKHDYSRNKHHSSPNLRFIVIDDAADKPQNRRTPVQQLKQKGFYGIYVGFFDQYMEHLSAKIYAERAGHGKDRSDQAKDKGCNAFFPFFSFRYYREYIDYLYFIIAYLKNKWFKTKFQVSIKFSRN